MARADQTLQSALVEAIEDEYRARALYTAAIDRFGPVGPLPNIAEAESRHVEALVPLFEEHGFDVPEDRFMGQVDVPDSLGEVCQLGVVAEEENEAMYRRLIARVEDERTQAVFAKLGHASGDNHLAAFEACVAREVVPVPPAQSDVAAPALGLLGGAGLAATARAAGPWGFVLGAVAGAALVLVLKAGKRQRG
ncbi:ferritin-like domain-containing protein [Celeribacter persicus]|uniref:DUF2202 domain-containing protein n=1 Tax=Celeribacter persicus TaxID=1651082 RepID=A0A2T5HJZ7_9RHOB|nr:hypothetical protein [Celeribacter persicus]PTQ71893.1 hypothetical protein C8N42_10772 [Celeribacter persicus]